MGTQFLDCVQSWLFSWDILVKGFVSFATFFIKRILDFQLHIITLIAVIHFSIEKFIRVMHFTLSYEDRTQILRNSYWLLKFGSQSWWKTIFGNSMCSCKDAEKIIKYLESFLQFRFHVKCYPPFVEKMPVNFSVQTVCGEIRCARARSWKQFFYSMKPIG